MRVKHEECKQHIHKDKPVVIRQFDLQDIEAFYQYRANPSIATYQSWENYTYEEAESFV